MFKKIKEFRNWCKAPLWKAADGGPETLSGGYILYLLVFWAIGFLITYKFVLDKIADLVDWIIEKFDDWKQKHPKKEKRKYQKYSDFYYGMED